MGNDYAFPGRVECLNEISPGKICRAHRSPGEKRCWVCGIPGPTRPVYDHHHDSAAPSREDLVFPIRYRTQAGR